MRKYKNYLWIEKNGDVYTVGMTPELQDDVGTIGYVEFTKEDLLEEHDVILNLEASKTIMGVVTPIAGRVVERNLDAEITPTLLNSEKAEEHWLIRLVDVDQSIFDSFEDE